MKSTKLPALIENFLTTYDHVEKDQIWQSQSKLVQDFFNIRLLSDAEGEIPDEECDEIIRILDRSGKGNTKGCEAVARAMVPQGAWRRIFNEFHKDHELCRLVVSISEESNPERKAKLIDELYEKNKDAKNNLTGPSGNMIGAFLAAFDPVENLSMISLKHRRVLLQYLEPELDYDWEQDSIGRKIVETNSLATKALNDIGVIGTARTLTRFCYYAPFRELWNPSDTVKRSDKSVNVTIPGSEDVESTDEDPDFDTVRESFQMQARIAKIGVAMGFRIWLPRADRSRVIKVWTPDDDDLLDDLPLGYDSTTMKTVEQIDVLWLKGRSIVRAFEVEHTTSIYSGLLRMADLVALQPNIDIKLHIVAPDQKRDKVIQEIQRPVFSLLEGKALSEMCSYISYSGILDLSKLKYLQHTKNQVLEDFAEYATDDA
jgi:hypothetical protein